MCRKPAFITVTAAITLVLCGCGNTPSNDVLWLAAIGSDTLSVSEFASIWSELDAGQREVFLSGSSPSRKFIEALLRKELLLRELDALGYTDDPSLAAFGESWLRIENAVLSGRLLHNEMETAVTQEDLARYRTSPCRNVCFTVEPDSPEEVSYPHVDMRVLPLEIYEHLDTLPPGAVGTDISGTLVHLDSITPSRFTHSTHTTANADSIDSWTIANQRTRLFMIKAQVIMEREHSFSVDSVALERFALNTTGISSIQPEDTIIRSNIRNWTATELRYEVNFLNTMMPVQPNSYGWLCFLIKGIILHTCLLEYTGEFYPESLDSLRTERDAWTENLALDRMYKELISDRIMVGETDIEEQYALLEEPIMFEERRILETAIVPEDRIFEYEHIASEDNLKEMIVGLHPLQRLSDDTLRPSISRPLRLVEVPAALGPVVFRLMPSDTISWNGPYPIDEADGFVLFRLAGVIPAREAEMEEILYDLEVMAERRLKEHATVNWMLELEEQYGVIVNEAVLNNLPANPGEW